MSRILRRLLPAVLLPFFVVACESSGTGPRTTGTVSVMLTDAPGDFHNAIVTISNIQLLGDGGTVTLMDEPVTVDLLTLQNEVMTLVGETPVPGGRYSEMRIVISDGLIVVEQPDGSTRVYASSPAFATSQGFTATGQLQMPSLAQSGLKIKLPSDAADIDGDDNAILVDFNVAGSFGHQAGNSGRWVMHPVIHATSFTQTGAIRLAVQLGEDVELPVIDDVQITLAMLSGLLDRNGDIIPVAFTDVDDDGIFVAEFRFLPPGSYSLGLGLVEGLVLTTDPVFPLTVEVTAGQTAERLVTITAADTE
jgi:hypothetical protein